MKINTKKYGLSFADQFTYQRLALEGRIALTAAEVGIRHGWLGLIRVIDRPAGVCIGDIIIPSTGFFAGVPLRVAGFGGRQLRLRPVPGFGVGPTGRVGFLICDAFYKDGMNVGLRINLPVKER